MAAQKESGAIKRKTIKVLISALSILTLDFCFSVLNKIITTWKGDYNNYWLTGFGMLAIVVLFLPAVSIPDLLNRVTEQLLKFTIKIGRLFLGEWVVIFLVFSLTLFFLYVGFYWVWFDKVVFINEAANLNPLEQIKQWKW